MTIVRFLLIVLFNYSYVLLRIKGKNIHMI